MKDKKCFKIAVPVFEWRVAPRLDTAEKMLFATVEDGKVVDEEEVRIVGVHPLNIAHWFRDEGIEVVICCGVDATCSSLLLENGIDLVSWIAGNAREAIRAYLDGTLSSMAIPVDTLGGRPFRKRFRGGRWRNE
jgi:predicted Fe-Mo cluster-binding NifX family protein